MPTFEVPVRWEMYGWAKVEADNIDEAYDKAWEEVKLSDVDADYVVGSFEVDTEYLAMLELSETEKKKNV